MKKQKNKPRKTVGYGYVGEWLDKSLGWFLPRHLSNQDTAKRPSTPYQTFDSMVSSKGFFCKITIEEIPNKRRRRVRQTNLG